MWVRDGSRPWSIVRRVGSGSGGTSAAPWKLSPVQGSKEGRILVLDRGSSCFIRVSSTGSVRRRGGPMMLLRSASGQRELVAASVAGASTFAEPGTAGAGRSKESKSERSDFCRACPAGRLLPTGIRETSQVRLPSLSSRGGAVIVMRSLCHDGASSHDSTRRSVRSPGVVRRDWGTVFIISSTGPAKRTRSLGCRRRFAA